MKLKLACIAFSLVFLIGCKTTQASSRQPYIGNNAPINSNSTFDPFTSSDSATPIQSPVSSGSAGLSTATCVEGSQDICDIEVEIYKQVNVLRLAGSKSNFNIPFFSRNYDPTNPLSFDAKASWVAREWSKEQARKGNIGHQGFGSGAREKSFMAKFGQSINFTSENVAYNGGARSGLAADIAKQFMNQWINSSGHLANIMGRHDFIAVGIAKDSDGYYYGTQLFGRN